jgi:hypothetical protein
MGDFPGFVGGLDMVGGYFHVFSHKGTKALRRFYMATKTQWH